MQRSLIETERKLTPEEKRQRDLLEFNALEQIVEENEPFFLQYVQAMLAIRERKLWELAVSANGEQLYVDWDDYCKRRWGRTSRAINYRLQAQKIGKEMEIVNKVEEKIFPEGSLVPDSHMRSLSGFAAEDRTAIYELACKRKPQAELTADDIENAAHDFMADREEKRREAVLNPVGTARPEKTKTSKKPQKDNKPTYADEITKAAAKHIITCAKAIKDTISALFRWIRKGRRNLSTLDGWEVQIEGRLARHADRIEGILGDLDAADRKSLGSAKDVVAALGELRKDIKGKAAIRKRLGQAVDAAEEDLEAYQSSLAERLHENEDEAA